MADNFTILTQKPNVSINPSGTGFQDVWEITYRVTDGPSKGTVGTLTVPEEDHNAAYISAAILAKVKDLDAIAGL
jgi:hypothetical protein